MVVARDPGPGPLEDACGQAGSGRGGGWDVPPRGGRFPYPHKRLHAMSADWFPVVFIVFKVVVLGVAMFFAIKWHHDKDKLEKEKAAREAREAAARQPRAPE
ncbi:hypothetical protein EIM50_15510 [Pseudoxanthomonas sp. SGD-10]|nr:hypothetical protein EIM50_15510 [Pseudoxanthomonas sp. SGD-10]